MNDDGFVLLFVVFERWVASREGSRREKEIKGGDNEIEVREDRVAPWLCSRGP